MTGATTDQNQAKQGIKRQKNDYSHTQKSQNRENYLYCQQNFTEFKLNHASQTHVRHPDGSKSEATCKTCLNSVKSVDTKHRKTEGIATKKHRLFTPKSRIFHAKQPFFNVNCP